VGVIGRRRRIVLDHTDPPLVALCAENPALAHESQLQTLRLKRFVDCRKRQGRIRR
jgi:hypothetical protein